MDYYPLILGDDKPLQASLFPIHQHVQVPNMEESSPMFQPYGYGLCREIPTPENSLKKGTAQTPPHEAYAFAAQRWQHASGRHGCFFLSDTGEEV